MNFILRPPSPIPLLMAALLLMQGCQSYEIVQRLIFADDDGNVVVVDYGRSESEHNNTFISPVTGKEVDFRSKLIVKVQLPDGDTIKAWQCMNFLPRGTMYMTDNEEWKFLQDSFSFSIYHQTGEPPPRDYLEVFRGVVCDIPDRKVKKDERWHEVLRHGREYKQPKPVSKK